jgi:hypothetical protein
VKQKEGSRRTEELDRFRDRFMRNTAWMHDQDADYVEKQKIAWSTGKKDGFALLPRTEF